jgi:plastocyanin
MRLKAALLTLVPVLVVLASGCGGESDEATDSGSDSGSASVEIVDYLYEPADLTVPAGTTVNFTNEDTTGHTATSERSGAFDSGSIGAGESGEITLEEPGTFAYYCAFHPFMKGKITVE